jgi:hypothetical protein
MRAFTKDRLQKIFNFASQVEVGTAGELRFLERYPRLSRKGLKECDFAMPNGQWIELKTDSRAEKDTGNFFFEVHSNLDRGTPGGPWQAYGKGADFFVYQFSCGAEWWFPCEPLILFLEKTNMQWEAKKIGNEGWAAAGLVVPVDAVRHLALEVPQCLAP